MAFSKTSYLNCRLWSENEMAMELLCKWKPFRCMGSSGWCKLPNRENGSTRKKVLQMLEKEKSALKFITMMSQEAESYLGLCLNCRNQNYTKS